MIPVHSVAQIRAAEATAFLVVPEDALMQRAAHALSGSCGRLLSDMRGGIVGSRVLLLVGAGNNGGDALWAGARLAARGARVDAVLVSERVHREGAAALARAGGRLHRVGAPEVDDLVGRADLVVDGILGIGGTGGLRPDAGALAAAVESSGALVVSVDLPSGVDADTGVVSGAAVRADLTVTFAAMKPGLLVMPGRMRSGTVEVVDIGIDMDEAPVAGVLTAADVAPWVAEPPEDAYKYRRGVLGVAAGSRAYPGAALLVTSAARHANVGMVRYLDRDDGNAARVVEHYPDIVVDGSPPAGQARATAWACGSGFPGDHLDEVTVAAVLAAEVPVVLDAGALTVLASSQEARTRLTERRRCGWWTVLTPHDGEFERLCPGLLGAASGRVAAAAAAAADLGAVVVLKGPGSIVAGASGPTFLDVEGTADLGTAGTGDVLTGVLGAVLAAAWSDGRRADADLVTATAAAVWLHGRAGRIASEGGPVTATDVAAAVPAAIRDVRREVAS